MLLLLLLFHVDFCRLLQISGRALRFCRELNYECVINDAARATLNLPPDAPQNADQQLVNRFVELSKRIDVNQTCLFHWKNLMCSYVFASGERRPPCFSLCADVKRHCVATAVDSLLVDCAASNYSTACTNYAALTGLCTAARANREHAPPSIPVYNYYYGDGAPRRIDFLSLLFSACVLFSG